MRNKLVRETLNEAVVPANRELYYDFFRIMLEVHDEQPDDPFYELNERLNPIGVYFVDHEKYFAEVEEPERSTFMKMNMMPHVGIRLFVFDAPTAQIRIIVDKTFDDKFLRMSSRELEMLLDRLWTAFGHETVHRGQVGKMKTAQDPDFDTEEDYFKDPQEIMAMAWSFVEDLKQHHSKDDIIEFLRTKEMPLPAHMRGMRPPPGMFNGRRMPMGPPPHPLYLRYKELGGKWFKLFTKYAYQYLTED